MSHHECTGKLNVGPLERQPVFLTPEQSTQPHEVTQWAPGGAGHQQNKAVIKSVKPTAHPP